MSLHALWNRRQSTKFNGVSYPVQKAAEAVYSRPGTGPDQRIDIRLSGQCRYHRPGRWKIWALHTPAGDNSPYIWVDGQGRDSWEFFDLLFNQAAVVCTPGGGFGRCGSPYIRISAFNSRENVIQAMDRLKEAFK
jgi:LL-diaminopimelate aminotransferase